MSAEDNSNNGNDQMDSDSDGDFRELPYTEYVDFLKRLNTGKPYLNLDLDLVGLQEIKYSWCSNSNSNKSSKKTNNSSFKKPLKAVIPVWQPGSSLANQNQNNHINSTVTNNTNNSIYKDDDINNALGILQQPNGSKIFLENSSTVFERKCNDLFQQYDRELERDEQWQTKSSYYNSKSQIKFDFNDSFFSSGNISKDKIKEEISQSLEKEESNNLNSMYSSKLRLPGYMSPLRRENAYIAEPVNKIKFRMDEDGVTPLLYRPLKTKIEAEVLKKKEIEDCIKRDKKYRALARIPSADFKVTDRDGVEYGYDWRGYKVPLDAIAKAPVPVTVVRMEQDCVNTGVHDGTWTGTGPVFLGKIIEKTEAYLKAQDDIKRERSEEGKKWAPFKYPSTTFRLHADSEVLPMSAVRRWREYSHMKDGDVLATVEYCCDCWEHDDYFHHDEKRYLQVAESVKREIFEIFDLYSIENHNCVLIPISRHENKNNKNSKRKNYSNKSKSNSFLNDKILICGLDTSNRIGALEVQVAVKYQGAFTCHVLHSKLFRGSWPRMQVIAVLCGRLLDDIGFMRVDGTVTEIPLASSTAQNNNNNINHANKVLTSINAFSNSKVIEAVPLVLPSRIAEPLIKSPPVISVAAAQSKPQHELTPATTLSTNIKTATLLSLELKEITLETPKQNNNPSQSNESFSPINKPSRRDSLRVSGEYVADMIETALFTTSINTNQTPDKDKLKLSSISPKSGNTSPDNKSQNHSQQQHNNPSPSSSSSYNMNTFTNPTENIPVPSPGAGLKMKNSSVPGNADKISRKVSLLTESEVHTTLGEELFNKFIFDESESDVLNETSSELISLSTPNIPFASSGSPAAAIQKSKGIPLTRHKDTAKLNEDISLGDDDEDDDFRNKLHSFNTKVV